MSNNETESRYYCAGRYCTMREQCHRHTSSTGVNRAPFEDYDLVALKPKLATLCDRCKFLGRSALRQD